MSEQTIRSVCRMCHGGCGALIHVRDGRVQSVTGDRHNPNNTGFLCTKGRAAPELAAHPDRLTRPLRRTGPKGSRRFEPIGWDQAYDILAGKLAASRDRFGAESVVLAQGTDRNFQEWTFRFANAFGTPNVLGPAHVCFYPRVMASLLTMGAFTFCDYEGGPRCVMLWGSNKAVCHSDGVIGVRLLKALRQKPALIVVDPRRTALAARADHWLQVRPGTDAALALAFLHVIIDRGLYDAEFVGQYTFGFDALREHVRAYDPDRVSQITGIAVRQIEAAAICFGSTRPAAIESGTGVEQNRNSFHCMRALVILSAVSGNLDRAGGNVIWDPSGVVGRRAFPASNLLPEGQVAKRLGGDRHRVLSLAGWAHPGAVWRAILEGAPYPVKAMLVLGSNPLVSYADSEQVHRALSAVEFLAVADLFLTPTAELADLVLPVASWLERDQIVEFASYLAARRQAVQVGECTTDEELLNTLAGRLGLEGFWPTAADALDDKLKPLGTSWTRYAVEGYLPGRLVYEKHRTAGFRTPNGKFNIYSNALKQMGYEPLPVHRPIPVPADEAGPYLLTSAHSAHYFNSEFRHLPSLRRLEPHPAAEMHSSTAAREGIGEGDPVVVAVGRREAVFVARLTDAVAPEVVCVPASWWYPELAPEKTGVAPT